MKDQTMTPEQIKNLHEAALTVATSLMAVMPEANAEYLERAIGAGGRIVLELGPLPDMRRVCRGQVFSDIPIGEVRSS